MLMGSEPYNRNYLAFKVIEQLNVGGPYWVACYKITILCVIVLVIVPVIVDSISNQDFFK